MSHERPGVKPYTKKVKVYTIEAKKRYKIELVVDGKVEDDLILHGDAREAARLARDIATGSPVEWVKGKTPQTKASRSITAKGERVEIAQSKKISGVARKHRSGPKPRGLRLPSGEPNTAFYRVRRVGETKFELDGRVYDISKNEALYALRDKIGVTNARNLKAELMTR